MKCKCGREMGEDIAYFCIGCSMPEDLCNCEDEFK